MLFRSSRYSRAQRAVSRLDGVLASSDEWIGTGLGRRAIEVAHRLVVDTPSSEEARSVYDAAHRWLLRSPDLSMAGLEAAYYAAERCGETGHQAEFLNQAAAEQERIDQFFGDTESSA